MDGDDIRLMDINTVKFLISTGTEYTIIPKKYLKQLTTCGVDDSILSKEATRAKLSALDGLPKNLDCVLCCIDLACSIDCFRTFDKFYFFVTEDLDFPIVGRDLLMCLEPLEFCVGVMIPPEVFNDGEYLSKFSDMQAIHLDTVS